MEKKQNDWWGEDINNNDDDYYPNEWNEETLSSVPIDKIILKKPIGKTELKKKDIIEYVAQKINNNVKLISNINNAYEEMKKLCPPETKNVFEYLSKINTYYNDNNKILNLKNASFNKYRSNKRNVFDWYMIEMMQIGMDQNSNKLNDFIKKFEDKDHIVQMIISEFQYVPSKQFIKSLEVYIVNENNKKVYYGYILKIIIDNISKESDDYKYSYIKYILNKHNLEWNEKNSIIFSQTFKKETFSETFDTDSDDDSDDESISFPYALFNKLYNSEYGYINMYISGFYLYSLFGLVNAEKYQYGIPYGNIYGRDAILNTLTKHKSTFKKSMVELNMLKLYAMNILKLSSSEKDITNYAKYIIDEKEYKKWKRPIDDIINSHSIYYPRVSFSELYNNQFIRNKMIYQLNNPKIEYVKFVDGGDNDSTFSSTTLYYDLSENYKYQKAIDIPEKNTSDRTTDGTELKNLNNTLSSSEIKCVGRTIFVKDANNNLHAIKLKKQKEELSELAYEKRMIIWITKNEKLSKIFSYLRANSNTIVESESVLNLSNEIKKQLDQQIINSGSGYQIDTENNEYKYITYQIHNVDLELGKVFNFINQIEKTCSDILKDNSITDIQYRNSLYQDCMENIKYQFSVIEKKIGTKIDSMDFVEYLENSKLDEQSDSLFLSKSILNLSQAANLINNGLVHSSLINMFHNIGHDRRFITIANILDLQHHRRGIGRLTNIFDSSIFSNFRVAGIADFAEIITLDNFKSKLLSSLNGTNIYNHLKLSMCPDKYVELEALQSQFFSWSMILLRKVFITDKFYKETDKEKIIRMKEYIKITVKSCLYYYCAVYLNQDISKIESMIKELIPEKHFTLMVNQMFYFLTREFVNNIDKYGVEKHIEILYDKHIFDKSTIIRLPNIQKASKGDNFKEIYESLLTNPRGWCTVIFVDNGDKVVDSVNLGWFYFMSEEGNQMTQEAVEKLIGYKLKYYFHEPKQSILLVLEVASNDDPKKISDDIYESIYYKIDGGAVNGSFPLQDLFFIMNNVFFYCTCIKFHHKTVNLTEMKKIIINKFETIGDNLLDQSINYLYLDMLGKNTSLQKNMQTFVGAKLNFNLDKIVDTNNILQYNLRTSLLLDNLATVLKNIDKKVILLNLDKLLQICGNLIFTYVTDVNIEKILKIYDTTLKPLISSGSTKSDFKENVKTMLTTMKQSFDRCYENLDNNSYRLSWEINSRKDLYLMSYDIYGYIFYPYQNNGILDKLFLEINVTDEDIKFYYMDKNSEIDDEISEITQQKAGYFHKYLKYKTKYLNLKQDAIHIF
jgi:hypothetical protein